MILKIRRNRMSRVIYEGVAVHRPRTISFCMCCESSIGRDPHIRYTSRYFSETSRLIRKFTYILCIKCCRTMAGVTIARCLQELEKRKSI